MTSNVANVLIQLEVAGCLDFLELYFRAGGWR